MVAVKEKIGALIDVMPTNEAERLLSYIIKNYRLTSDIDLWDAIEEEEPDEFDKQMMYEMENDPDCNDFS